MKRIGKFIKFLGNLVLCAALFLALLYVGLIKFAPQAADRVFHYRAYVIRTDSMVPTIPVGSLVISKRLGPEEALNPGTIITFNANRFGDSIVLTHYFRGVTMQDGELRYFTQPEGDHPYDGYVTHRDDILGTYVFHVPYIGKIAEFLQSVYGVVMLVALILIWLVNRYLKLRAKNAPVGQVDVTRVKFHPGIMECTLQGVLENHCADTLRLLTLNVTLFNVFGDKIGDYPLDPLGGKPLKPGGKTTFRFHMANVPNVAAYTITSKEITLDYSGISVRPKKSKEDAMESKRKN